MMRPAGVMPGGRRRCSVVVVVVVVVAAAAAGAVAAGTESAMSASEVWQFGDSLAALRCRQASASGPPGGTPLQLRE